MSNTTRPRAPWHLLLVALLLCPIFSHACSATDQDVFSVGDTASDAACDYNTIQSAINAATCPAGTKIYVTSELNYTAQHLSISSKNISLIGRGTGSSCGGVAVQCGVLIPCPTAPLATISGSGHSGDGVITIRGSSTVTLRYLAITDGNHSGDGGGIDYSGTGTLTLDTSTLSQNSAGYGGAINFKGSGGHADLYLDHYTLILLNTANVSGGGIRVEGDARLIMTGADSTISGNAAKTGYGGGIEILGPARADLSGYGSYVPIASNSAVNGGGIAVIDNGNGEAVLRTFASGQTHTPMQISNNSASTGGGALYLDQMADACLYATRVESNTAPEGAAYYKDDIDMDTGLYVNGGSPDRLGTDCGPESVETLGGSVVCAPGAACSTFNGNTAASGGILYDLGSHIVGTRFTLQHNDGAYAISSGGAAVNLKRCLVTDNHASDTLIRVDYASASTGLSESFDECTITNNTIDGSYVFEFLESGPVELSYDIIEAATASTVHFTPSAGSSQATITAGYVMASEIGTLPAAQNPSIVTGSAYFVDPAHGDYHLAPFAQTALDFGPGLGDADIDGNIGSIDLLPISNRFGTADLGAYERQNMFYNCGDSESIFCTNFDQ